MGLRVSLKYAIEDRWVKTILPIYETSKNKYKYCF